MSANARVSHHRKPVPSIADVERELSPTRTEWATTRITALERKQVYARLLWIDDYKSLFQADGSGNQTLLSNLVGTYTSAHTRRLMQRDSILSWILSLMDTERHTPGQSGMSCMMLYIMGTHGLGTDPMRALCLIIALGLR